MTKQGVNNYHNFAKTSYSEKMHTLILLIKSFRTPTQSWTFIFSGISPPSSRDSRKFCMRAVLPDFLNIPETIFELSIFYLSVLSCVKNKMSSRFCLKLFYGSLVYLLNNIQSTSFFIFISIKL